MVAMDRKLLSVLTAIALLLSLMASAAVVLAINMNKRHEVAGFAEKLAEREQEAEVLRTSVRLLADLRDLTERRHLLKRQLAVSQAELRILENNRNRLVARIETLRKTKTLHKVKAQKDRKKVKEEIELLKIDIEDLEQQIETVQREIKALEEGAISVTSLVPGGTQRKALFIECERQGAKLMPEGRMLSTDRAQALKDDVLEAARGKEQVMFLLRPDGFKAFRTFRKVIEKAGLAYGYQPVDGDWTLVYPSQ